MNLRHVQDLWEENLKTLLNNEKTFEYIKYTMFLNKKTYHYKDNSPDLSSNSIQFQLQKLSVEFF